MKPVRLSRVVVSCILALMAAAAFDQAALGQDSKGSVTVLAADGEALLSLGGLLQVQFEDGDRGDSRFPATGEDRFYLRRARMNATGTFAEQFDFRVEFDLAGTLGSTNGLRAQMTDGYVNWNHYAGVVVPVDVAVRHLGSQPVGAAERPREIEFDAEIELLGESARGVHPGAAQIEA